MVKNSEATRAPVLERQGDSRVGYSIRYPRVIGGTCEYCGVIDRGRPAEVQYLLCQHYKDIGMIRCSYCDETQDPTQVLLHNSINVATHPDNPNKLVAWCGSYKCSEAHTKRFDPSRQ